MTRSEPLSTAVRIGSGGKHGDRGLTLLEVLAAVAILAIVFSMLFSGATQGLRAQGDNRQRIRAAQLADKALAEIVSQIQLGDFPEVDRGEEEVDEHFLVVAEVMLFEDAGDEFTVAANDPYSDEPSDTIALLQFEAPDLLEMMRAIRVEVSWLDGANERQVVRSSFALDLAAAQEAYGVGGAGGLPGGDERDAIEGVAQDAIDRALGETGLPDELPGEFPE